MNTIIMSLLFQNTAETLRFIMVDPKRVELTLYNGIPHLLTPVITNTQKTVNALKWTIGEMDRRFEVLAAAGNRDINSYNARHPSSKIPAIIFVIDELADLMATAASEVESGIIRLAQMARAVGIHLIVATQRPSVDVITGLMKANIPGRIAFSVASLIDSRTILDSPGAEKLLGRGDMLFQTAELSKPVRIQGAFISEDELKSVVDYLKGDEPPEYDESIVEKNNGTGTMSMFGGPSDDRDPLFNEAKAEIIRAGKASASFLQRKFKVGYARAARLLDELEAAGVIGPGEGAKPREILVTATEISDTMDAGGSLNVFDNTIEEDGSSEENLDLESEDDAKQN
jgi:S-DNA-T family DNA segregation ATPase FtsK/SpoIIIE